MSLPINNDFLSHLAQGKLNEYATEAARLLARLGVADMTPDIAMNKLGTATGTTRLTRAQILQEAASAIMTQANGTPRAVPASTR